MGFYLVMIAVVAALGAVLWARSVPRSQELGVGPGGRLAPCPDTPNCISSTATDGKHFMAPWPYTGSAQEARARLLLILRLLPNVKVVAEEPTYLAAEFRVAQIFVDDVEFLLDTQNHLVHFRSASRIGKSDFGVNRKRMQRIADAFQASLTPAQPAPALSDSSAAEMPPAEKDEMSL